jgi:hypothetical protein
MLAGPLRQQGVRVTTDVAFGPRARSRHSREGYPLSRAAPSCALHEHRLAPHSRVSGAVAADEACGLAFSREVRGSARSMTCGRQTGVARS